MTQRVQGQRPRQTQRTQRSGGTKKAGRTGELPYKGMVRLAQKHGFTVTATTGGKHNKGSLHGQGRAIDVRTRDKSAAQVREFIAAAKAAGYNVKDERTRPKRQAVWSGPHLHISK